MKNKTRYILFASVLCIGAFFMPMKARAQGIADTTPPTVSVELTDTMLHIEADDDNSGVDAVFIGDKRISYHADNTADLAFDDYAGTGDKTVSIYAVDLAGNQSEVVEVANPYYVSGKVPGVSASASVDPEAEPDTQAKGFTPAGQAAIVDEATEKDGKEFYVFTTPSDNVFYLVIDKQRDSDNVYFLNAVTEDDLIALTGKNTKGSVESGSAIPETRTCICTDKCGIGRVNISCPVCKNDLNVCTGREAEPSETERVEVEGPEQKGKSGTLIFVLLAAAAVGGAGYYLKIYKPKHDLDDAEDLDDLLDGDDEPEINEEDMEMSGQAGMQQEIDTDAGMGSGTETMSYDDYPDDDYPDGGPEQGE